MTQAYLYASLGVSVFALALHALIHNVDLLRKILAVNVMCSGVFLVLVALASRTPGGVDPVPHAMVITGIVITVSATALALILMLRVYQTTGKNELSDGREE
ncbi:multisubunit sodium/proton antiporter, MrpC subunit [Ferrimonas sediminum]|uniref:Multisubunit sodium/proton antiporter, MrpC subunit n=1 Tax=Ferrimonas sediminum TaxID=718193 RepID=A0A1G8RH96_9GAMM|nr:NADH-quinone oxidoreductase subunit K [Ferrimonas sediminum]SDJ16338.1 multisubunit sodium/proton antiporter, MrpC subunit [Ferrimonas sediminum]